MAGIQYENEELKVKINDLEKRNIRAKQLIKEKVTSLSLLVALLIVLSMYLILIASRS